MRIILTIMCVLLLGCSKKTVQLEGEYCYQKRGDTWAQKMKFINADSVVYYSQYDTTIVLDNVGNYTIKGKKYKAVLHHHTQSEFKPVVKVIKEKERGELNFIKVKGRVLNINDTTKAITPATYFIDGLKHWNEYIVTDSLGYFSIKINVKEVKGKYFYIKPISYRDEPMFTMNKEKDYELLIKAQEYTYQYTFRDFMKFNPEDSSLSKGKGYFLNTYKKCE